MILDDTTWRRWTRKAEAASFVWDSTTAKVVFGMSIVVLIWTDGKRKVPLGKRVWRKGGKSKVELAEELLREARQRRISPEFVLFDSWYSAKKLMYLIADFRGDMFVERNAIGYLKMSKSKSGFVIGLDAKWVV